MNENMIYKDKNKDIEERVNDLLKRMSVEEKIGQLVEIGGWNVYTKENGNIEIKDEYKKMLSGDGIGAIWAFLRADWWTGRSWDSGLTPFECAKAVNMIQKFTIENTRWGIPLFLSEECAHGLMSLGSTVFPTGLGQASTFNPSLIKRMGEVVAKETRASGAHIAYGPVLDLAREPRWSRVEEGFGEDPYLASKLGEAYMKGLQGDKFSPQEGKVISTLKHFAGHGQPEGGHNSHAAHMGERELHDFHLSAFRHCVKEGALSVMTSYNHIDGVPCTGSRKLLTDILRKQWGFEGFTVSDAAATNGLRNAMRVAKDYSEAAAIALKAGVDMDLCGIPYPKHLKEALDKGLVNIEDIDQAASRILKLKFKMGLFEKPYVDDNLPNITLGCKANKDIALEVAKESLILLENKNKILPLNNEIKSIAVIGPNADAIMNQLGDYTAPQQRGNIVSVLDGIRQLSNEDIKVRYSKGCKIRSKNREGFKEAIKFAKESDITILVLGGSSAPEANTGFLENGAARISEIMRDSEFDKDSGEGYDRAFLDLAGVQIELLSELKKTGKPIIVVLIMGRPLKLEEVTRQADAVLLAWYPGMEGGRAIAEAIFGKYNPGGRLPISIPLSEGQIPIFYNTTGMRSNYIDLLSQPLYSFGFGLSYTEFVYSDFKLNKETINSNESLIAEVTVTNIGKKEGDEVVQLYIKDEIASVVRPLIELKGFERVRIKAGESKKVTFEISPNDLAFHNESMEYVVEPGDFTIMIGGNLKNNLSGKFKVV